MNSKAIVTTSWDDGHPLDLRLSDWLHEHGLAATFYIPRRSQRDTLDEKAVNELSRQFEIGAHTMDHIPLTSLDSQAARNQIRDSRDWVTQTIGNPCEMFCPPLGKFRSSHVEIMAEVGYRGFRTVEFLQTDFPRPVAGGGEHSFWEMATSVQAQPHSRSSFLKNALKRRKLRTAAFAAFASNVHPWPRLTEQLASKVIAQGGVLHLWGHSWEIDENDQWQNLKRVLVWLGELIRDGELTPMTNGALIKSRIGRMSQDANHGLES